MEFNSILLGQRTAVTWEIEDGTACITILKPFSQEIGHINKYLVLYEDAFGNTKLEHKTISEIAKDYLINIHEIEEMNL
jgi:hypothetical protein